MSSRSPSSEADAVATRARPWPIALLCLVTALAATGLHAQEARQVVELSNIEFRPRRIQAEPGATVRFVNRDPFDHDVYIVGAADLNRVVVPATLLHAGESTTVTIDEAGLFRVYCTIHGGMQAKLTTSGTFELTAEQKKRAAEAPSLPPEVAAGERLFWGRAMCHQCHSVGERGDGLRGPNLDSVGFRAASQAERQGLDSATAYLVRSLIEPSSYVVPGYSDDMPELYREPLDLGRDELEAIVAYLQSLGGTVDTWSIAIPADRLDPPPPFNPFAGGDPERGREVFFGTAECARCHAVGDHVPASMGPDLTVIGRYRDWRWLAQSVIDPGAEVGANWKSATVRLSLWESVDGILQEQDGDEIHLLTSGNRLRSFQTSEVESLEIAEGTRMPAFGDSLTVQQMADLISYLSSLRGEDEPAE